MLNDVRSVNECWLLASTLFHLYFMNFLYRLDVCSGMTYHGFGG